MRKKIARGRIDCIAEPANPLKDYNANAELSWLHKRHEETALRSPSEMRQHRAVGGHRCNCIGRKRTRRDIDLGAHGERPLRKGRFLSGLPATNRPALCHPAAEGGNNCHSQTRTHAHTLFANVGIARSASRRFPNSDVSEIDDVRERAFATTAEPAAASIRFTAFRIPSSAVNCAPPPTDRPTDDGRTDDSTYATAGLSCGSVV